MCTFWYNKIALQKSWSAVTIHISAISIPNSLMTFKLYSVLNLSIKRFYILVYKGTRYKILYGVFSPK